MQTPTKSRPANPGNWSLEGICMVVWLWSSDELVRVDSDMNVVASTRDTTS